jgi:predicted transcriptional regulator
VIRIIGNIRDFNIGDEIEVGPTPANKLYLRGEVVGRDDTMSRLILRVKEMLSVPKIPVKKIARRAVRISPDISLREATRIMVYNGVQEALVEGSPPGLINLDDIVKAVADGRVNTEVGEIMIRGFLIIESDEPIYEAIKILGRTGASQLVVSEAGTAWGVVDHKDLIKSLSHT